MGLPIIPQLLLYRLVIVLGSRIWVKLTIIKWVFITFLIIAFIYFLLFFLAFFFFFFLVSSPSVSFLQHPKLIYFTPSYISFTEQTIKTIQHKT